MKYKKNDLSTYSFVYLFIIICYLEEYLEIDYKRFNEFIEIEFNDGKLFMNEINWHLTKLISNEMINISDEKILINKNISPTDIMYIIKVNIKDFNNMIKIVNDYLVYDFNKNKELIKKKIM